MHKHIFINRYNGRYDFEEDENDEGIISFEDITVEFYENHECKDGSNTQCNIFSSFCFPDNENIFKNRETSFNQLLLLQHLSKSLSKIPEIQFEDCMGCPFIDIHIGYFNLDLEFETIDKIIYAFASFDPSSTLDKGYLQQNHPDEYAHYLDYSKQIIHTVSQPFKYYFGNEPISITEAFPNIFTNDVEAFVSEDRNMVLGFNEQDLSTILKKFTKIDSAFSTTCTVNKFIHGKEFSFALTNEHKIALPSNTITRIELFTDNLELSTIAYEECKINDRVILFRNYDRNFWALTTGLKDDMDSFFIRERAVIQDIYKEIHVHIPEHLATTDFDYKKLSPSAFEELCRDLLDKMGFVNTQLRGKTNAADGGVDIEALLYIDTIIDKRTERWIFQCKHTKGNIDRKDLSEIPHLLSDFNADKFGFFYSGTFTPQVLDRLRQLNATYWDCNKLTTELRKHTSISFRYFGI
ncbi:MAG: restriction endonuclease [Desulfovibrio sp.]|jgi:hypothetical protein|nr:restriction endonuclease [Desulfovibrio sp.]